MIWKKWMVWTNVVLIATIVVLLLSLWIRSSHFYLGGLHPKVQVAAQQLVENCRKRGIMIKITEGYRSFKRQNRLYAQGRTKPGEIVTYAKGGESFHNYGLAIDFALYDPKQNRLLWDLKVDGNGNGKSDWLEVVEEAKKLGFSWGGDWSNFKDYPHLEMTFGQKIWALKLKVKILRIFTFFLLDGV